MKYILRSVNTETFLINKSKPKFLNVIRDSKYSFLMLKLNAVGLNIHHNYNTDVSRENVSEYRFKLHILF